MIRIQIDSILIRKDKIVKIINSIRFNFIKLLSLGLIAQMRLDKETETVKILADVQVGEIENQVTKVKADRPHRMKFIKFFLLLALIEMMPKITENESVIEINKNMEYKL